VATAALLGVIVACVAKVVVELDDVGVPDEDGSPVVVPVPDVTDEAPGKEVAVPVLVPVPVVLAAEAPEEAPLAPADAVPLDVGPDDTPDGGIVPPLVAVPVGDVREEGMAMSDVADGSGDENDPLIPSSAKLGV
jgi:hypothetical protein